MHACASMLNERRESMRSAELVADNGLVLVGGRELALQVLGDGCGSAVGRWRPHVKGALVGDVEQHHGHGCATRVELAQFADLVGDAALLVGSGKDEMPLGTLGGACDQGYPALGGNDSPWTNVGIPSTSE